MAKDTFFTGQPVFNQLLQLIPRHIINKASRHHQSDRYYKRFKTYEHLVTMLYTSFHGCKSLREVTTGMMACTTRINHLGINYIPRRSTLSEANTNRSEKLFGDIYQQLYAHFYPDSSLWRASINRPDGKQIAFNLRFHSHLFHGSRENRWREIILFLRL